MSQKPTSPQALSTDPRELAAEATRLHRQGVQELIEVFRKAEGDDQHVVRYLLDQLSADGAITRDEASALQRIASALFDDSDPESALAQIQSVHNEVFSRAETSPLAVAVAGIAVDSLGNAIKDTQAGYGPKPDSSNVQKKGTSQADLAGALAGGKIGSAGGVWGGIIGGLAGGLGASYLAKKDQEVYLFHD